MAYFCPWQRVFFGCEGQKGEYLPLGALAGGALFGEMAGRSEILTLYEV